MSFAAGFNAGSGAVHRGQELRQQKERYEQEMGLRRAEEARQNQRFGWERDRQNNERAALADLEAMQGGLVQQQATGLSQPSAQMLHTQGYGGAAGGQAVRDAAGDFGREQRRMGLQPTYDQTADVPTRQATDAELARGAGRVALARGDLSAWRQLEGDRRASDTKAARQEEFKRLSGMKDQDLVGVFQQSINANPEMPAMVDFDPKTRKYLVVSQVPGVPSQSLSRAEMLQSMMGLWEVGNGDYTAGIQAIVQGAQGQRALQDKNFERSRGMSKDNADLFFKGRQADNDDQRTRNDGARLGIQRKAAETREQMERMGQVRQYQDPKSGEVREFYPVTSKDGVQWKEFERPAGLRPYSAKAAEGPAREIPAEGTRMQSGNGQAWQADGRGGRLALDAPAPSKRAAVLSKAGFEKELAEQLDWTPDGRYVAWGGMAYDVSDPRDMAELRATVTQHGADSIMMREMQARGGLDPRGGFAPRYTERRNDPMAAQRNLGRHHGGRVTE